MKVAAVVPAYNEAARITPVLDTLAATPSVDWIVVVDDGSRDDTAAVAQAHPACAAGRLQVLRQTPNQGKGAAMRRGGDSVDADILLFLDADLVGLSIAHVEALLAPVRSGKVVMALGVFRGGRGATTLAQILVPNISGQRAIRRDVFLRVPCVASTGYGVELAITNFVLAERLPMTHVVLKDVTHPMKEEKLGLVRGVVSRLRMYRQMLPHMIRRYAPRRKRR